MTDTNSRRLAAAIVIAAALLAAAIFYLGSRLSAGPSEQRIATIVDQRIAQVGATSLSDEQLAKHIQAGIVAYVQEQRRAKRERPNRLAKSVPPPNVEDHVYGNPDAPITLIEYSDFECPYCKRFHSTAKELVDRSNGQINWLFRHFPLAMHNPGAQKQAEAAECAAEIGGNDAFWRYADAIFARTQSGGQGFPVEKLVPLAGELGLDTARFRECLDSGRMAARVQADIRSGEQAGVTGTPGNILFDNRSGETIAIHGARPYDQAKAAAQQLLEAEAQ